MSLLPVSVVHTPLDSVLQFVKLAVRSLALASRSREPSTTVRSACIILRAVQSIDCADSPVAQRKHRVGGEILSLAKVNRNEVAIFFTESYGMVFLNRYLLPVEVHISHSVNAAQMNRMTQERTNERMNALSRELKFIYNRNYSCGM